MESAAALMPPSTALNGLLLSAETKYSRRPRNERIQYFINVQGESLSQYKESWCEIQVL